jgi:hypothetical protein
MFKIQTFNNNKIFRENREKRMRSNFFKKLNEQEVYNITDGLCVTLHEKYLKELGLCWDNISTDKSNDIDEIISDCIEQMHEEIKSRILDYLK